LIKLNPRYLERLAFCPGDCLKITVAAGDKDDGNVEAFGRIGRIDIRPKRLGISITSFLKNEFQAP
jgi:hypothetical protein